MGTTMSPFNPGLEKEWNWNCFRHLIDKITAVEQLLAITPNLHVDRLAGAKVSTWRQSISHCRTGQQNGAHTALCIRNGDPLYAMLPSELLRLLIVFGQRQNKVLSANQDARGQKHCSETQ